MEKKQNFADKTLHLSDKIQSKLRSKSTAVVKPIFHLVALFAQREKIAAEKIRREQVGTVPTFLSVCANKFAKWKIGLTLVH